MWSIDLLRRRNAAHDGRPTVTVHTQAGRQIVVDRCGYAGRAGVLPGMSVAHARALIPHGDLRLEPHDPEGDWRALLALARWANRWLPRVAPDSFGRGLSADITGCERLYRGEQNLVHSLHSKVSRLGFKARVVTASTLGCAWAVARFGSHATALISDGHEREALKPLPLAALRLDEATINGLTEVGVERIEHLLALSRRSLPSRFGPGVLHRLDQALGRLPEVLEPIAYDPPPWSEFVFNGPVRDVEMLALAARQVIGELCAQLLEHESGLRRLSFTLCRADLDDLAIEITVSRPSRDTRHLWSLLCPKLEKAQIGFGVEAVTATAKEVGRLAHRQLGPGAESTQVERELSELIDTLSARLGGRSIRRVQTVETHIPERVYRTTDAADSHVVHGRVTRSPRPSHLLHPPEPVCVMAVTPDGPVVSLDWQGQTRRVLYCQGPERITSQWWRSQHPTRDYFRVQDGGGRWLWVYREVEHGRWFIHGLWA